MSRDGQDAETGAERIFQFEPVAVRAVATFSRETSNLHTTGDDFAPLISPTGGDVDDSGAATPTGADLSETIFALQSDSIASQSGDPPVGASASLFGPATVTARNPRKALLMFWDEDTDAVAEDGDLSVELTAGTAVGGAGAEVFIPLPAAVWSALSLLGSIGLTTGLRRRSRSRLCR